MDAQGGTNWKTDSTSTQFDVWLMTFYNQGFKKIVYKMESNRYTFLFEKTIFFEKNKYAISSLFVDQISRLIKFVHEVPSSFWDFILQTYKNLEISELHFFKNFLGQNNWSIHEYFLKFSQKRENNVSIRFSSLKIFDNRNFIYKFCVAYTQINISIQLTRLTVIRGRGICAEKM